MIILVQWTKVPFGSTMVLGTVGPNVESQLSTSFQGNDEPSHPCFVHLYVTK
jgi:hypothetical protein